MNTEPQSTTTKPKGQYRLGTLLFTLVCVILCGVAGWWLYCGRMPPSDDELRTRFRPHSAEFLRLKNMILEEPTVLSVGDDNVGDCWLFHGKWTNHKPPYSEHTQAEMLQIVGIASERYQEYLDLLGAVGGYRVSKGLGQRPPGEVAVHIYRFGLTPSGICKNVIYCSGTPPSVVADTDAHLAGRPKGEVYAELGEGWYIEQQRN